MKLDEEKGWEAAEGQRDRGGTKGEPVGVVFIVLQNLLLKTATNWFFSKIPSDHCCGHRQKLLLPVA